MSPAETPGRVVLVTGGSRGLGEALVEHLLAGGWSVATCSRARPPKLAHWEETYPGKVLWGAVDATTPAGAGAFVKVAYQHFGRLDALVNNAASVTDGLLTMLRPGDIHRDLAVNLEATIATTQVAAKMMLAGRRGAIVTVTSVTGIRGFSGVSVYAATKAALDGFTRSLARELGPGGIRVNAVAPGHFDSAMTAGMGEKQLDALRRRTPLKRLAKLEDVVGAVDFLLSERASFISGQTLVVDGGMTC